MYKCPHCGNKGISGWEKLSLGLFRTVSCEECGNKVGVSYYVFLLIPFIIAIDLMFRYIGLSILWVITALIVETLILVFIYLKYVPLVPRQNSKGF